MTKKVATRRCGAALYFDSVQRRREVSQITFERLFWLFVAGSVIGWMIEGLFCVVKRGAWESHVVSVWGPFCILYGLGLAGFYAGSILLSGRSFLARFLAFGVVADVVELLCGLLLEFGLGMRAWSYVWHFMNVRGHISLQMTFAWGGLGALFSYAVPPITRLFDRLEGKTFHVVSVVCGVFMAVNLAFTAACIVRWSDRHFGVPPDNAFARMIDREYPDSYMRHRFCEWRFIR